MIREAKNRKKRRWIRWGTVTVALAVLAFFVTPSLLPRVLGKWRADVVFQIPQAPRTLFLTIDDAPSSATSEILAVLARHGVHATFFITGGRVHSPEQLTAITAGGHAVAHHLQTTQACSQLTMDDFERDFDQVDRLLASVGGVRLFRPPSDFGTREQISHVRSKGYRTVVGTMFPLDHAITLPAAQRGLARWLTVDGGIIILHDGNERGLRTASLLDRLLPEWKRRGYGFDRLELALER